MTKAIAEVVVEYQAILSKNGILDKIKRVEFNNPNLVGENFASSADYVTIDFENQELESLELFVKKHIIAESASGQAEMLEEMRVFDKEAMVYNQLVKDIVLLYNKETGSTDQLNFVPKCYYADSRRIVLENAVKRDYFLLCKRERQDFQTAKMVLKCLAAYHAASYAMIFKTGIEPFKSSYPLLNEIVFHEKAPAHVKWIFSTAVGNCIAFIEKAKNFSEKSKILAKFEEYKDGKAFEELCRVGGPKSENLFNVANHGDVWNNNILFHRDAKSNELDHLLLLDYQVGRIASPNMDLAQYLFTSVKPEVRRERLSELLSYYFESLKETVTNDLNTPFDHTFEDFYQDFVKKSPTGFWWFIAMNTLYNIIGEIGTDGLGAWMDKNPDKTDKISKVVVETIQEHFERVQ